jgi:TatA/E family protein of Tat protein translocase
MGSLGMPEILTILVIALIIFGPRKLPELGKTLGKSLAQFRKASEDFKRQWEDEVELEKRRLDAPPPIEGPDEVEAAAKSETDSSQAGYLPYGEGINAGEPEQPAVISDSVISDTEISNTEVSNTEVSDTAQEPVTVARGSDAVKETKRDWM